MSSLNTNRFPTFSAFNDYFFSCFDDPTVFDCQDFNLLKVVQEAVKLEYDFKSHIHRSVPSIALYHIIKGKVFSELKRKKVRLQQKLIQSENKPFLFLDLGRTQIDSVGNITSTYFHNILPLFCRELHTYGQLGNSNSELGFDFEASDIFEIEALLPVSKSDWVLRRALFQTFKNIKKYTRFQSFDLFAIQSGFSKFWQNYRAWNFLITLINPQKCVFICHYHNEALLLALKRNNVESIELQHGLIASENIFYVYPEKVSSVVKRALFADQILVYGEFWRKRLLQGVEYADEQIHIIGDYLFRAEAKDDSVAQIVAERIERGQKVILCTTQTSLHSYFLEYIPWLAKDLLSRGNPAFIFIKPHPAEPEGLYADLEQWPNVAVVQGNLDTWLQKADIHISIFSATLFEATRYGVPNFSLEAEARQDYVDSVVASGVSKLLRKGQNPLDLLEPTQTDSLAAELFSEFSPEVLLG